MATRNQKNLDAKKRQALKLKGDRPELSVREIANLTGLSHSTVDRTLKKMSQDNRKDTIFQGNPQATPGVSEKVQGQDDAIGLDFQDSPEPVEKKSLVDEGMNTLKGLLGFAPKDEKKSAPPVLSAKLDPKRQQFVESVTPTVSLAFMLSAAWMWGSIGPEYGQLAPDEATANRIVTPLVRIYARHASFLTDVNPDIADAGASLVALIGYVYTSLGVYQHIKAEKEHEQNNNGYRDYRSVPTAESGTHHAGSRQPDVSGASREHGSFSGGNGGHSSSIGGANLTPQEQAQHAALSQLAVRDFETRARRSGRV